MSDFAAKVLVALVIKVVEMLLASIGHEAEITKKPVGGTGQTNEEREKRVNEKTFGDNSTMRR